MTHRVAFLGLDKAWAASIIGPMDALRVANRIAQGISGEIEGNSQSPLFDVQLITLDGDAIACEGGVQLGGELVKADDYHQRQILFVPSFNIGSGQDVEAVIESWQPGIKWLKANAESFELVVGGCSGVYLLAEAGLLAEQSVTTAWWLERHFQRNFGEQGCSIVEGALCVRSGRYITGGGSSSFYDVVLRLVEERAGKHMARLLAKYLLVDNQRLSQAPYAILSQVDNEDPVVRKAEQWIRRHLAEDFRIDDIADHCAVSSRTLIRRFQKSLSESPQAFTQRLRIEKSKILLETTQLRLSEIVQRVGYNDESAFRRLFKKYCKVSPREYRRRFNPAVMVDEEAA